MGEVGASEGDLLGGLELTAQLCGRQCLAVCSARTLAGEDVVVVHLDDEPPAGSRAAFDAMVEHGRYGGLVIDRSDHRTLVAGPPAVGTLTYLPALAWPLDRRLEAFRKIVSFVEAFHEAGLFVGTLNPDFILLDEDLSPVLLGPAFAIYDERYSAPELRRSQQDATAHADVYSLGRLLHFVLTGESPGEIVGDPAELLDLVSFPAGLSRTIRKAVRFDPSDRYESVAAFAFDVDRYGRYREVGLAHPEVKEENFGGLSYRPPAQNKKSVKKPTDDATVIDQLADATGRIQEIKPFRLRQSTRAVLLVLGLLSLGAAFAITYIRGDAEWVRIALCGAAGLVGFALFNPGMEGEQRLRTLFAIFLASAMWASDAPAYVDRLANRAGLKALDPSIRVESLKSQIEKHGETRFKGVDLTGADLKDQVFLVADMENAILERADLSGATFLGVSLKGARFRGAILHGTMFTKSNVEGAVGLEEAECDELTQFPAGWRCVDGAPNRQSDSTTRPASD